MNSLDALATHVNAEYQSLVDDAANGKEIDPDRAIQICTAAGKPIEEFQGDVAKVEERIESQRVMDSEAERRAELSLIRDEIREVRRRKEATEQKLEKLAQESRDTYAKIEREERVLTKKLQDQGEALRIALDTARRVLGLPRPNTRS